MRPLLSVVVPCFNEAEVLWQTHRRLSAALTDIPDIDFEIIYVDDGSHDGTAAVLHGIQALSANVRTLRFSRNFGHQTAVTAGLEHASGDAVVLIDADLQDPPEVIAEMVARWREGYHVVYGQRTGRDGETPFKRATATVFYRLLNRLSDTPIPLDTGDFRLVDRRVVEVLRTMPERDRFVRGMVAWAGFRQIAVPYRRAARFAGESKYPLLAMIRFALDGFTSFSHAPLRLATWIGLLVSSAALATFIYVLVVGLVTSHWIASWTAMILAILFIGGAQLLSLGVVGEYIGRIYGESKRRPLYVLEEARGFDHSLVRTAREVPSSAVTGRRRTDDASRRPSRETDAGVPVFHEPSVASRADQSMA